MAPQSSLMYVCCRSLSWSTTVNSDKNLLPMIHAYKWKAGSHRESNPGHLWLESPPPVLCHWATTAGQPPALIILYIYCTAGTECLSCTPGRQPLYFQREARCSEPIHAYVCVLWSSAVRACETSLFNVSCWRWSLRLAPTMSLHFTIVLCCVYTYNCTQCIQL